MLTGKWFRAPGVRGLGNTLRLEKWLARVQENWWSFLGFLTALILLGAALVVLFVYSLVIAVPTTMLGWVGHLCRAIWREMLVIWQLLGWTKR